MTGVGYKDGKPMNIGRGMREAEAAGELWVPAWHSDAYCRQWDQYDEVYRVGAWRGSPPKYLLLEELVWVHPEDRQQLLQALDRPDLWNHVSEHGLEDHAGRLWK